MAVISNNLVCINKDQNVFDTKKRIKAASIDALRHKLFQAQRSTILSNQALFSLNNNQFDVCDAKLKSVLSEDPSNVRAVVLSAISLSRGKHLEVGIEFLEVSGLQYWYGWIFSHLFAYFVSIEIRSISGFRWNQWTRSSDYCPAPPPSSTGCYFKCFP